MNVTEKTGKVVAAVAVKETDELMLMTSKGQSVRIKVSQIRETGRNAQGVKLMTLNEGEIIQDVATVISEEEESAESTAEGAAEAPASSEAAAGEAPAEASEA
jgi:DNA gyrase subunit A